ncbi:MAG: hypothetical protein QM820_35890 [Minicystis sp.]
MITTRDLLGMSRRDLLRLLCEGHPIDAAALDDTEYRGVSLGLPEIVERLTWKTFQKVFHRDPATGHLRGWNVRLVQKGLDAASVPVQRRDGSPLTFGHYRVVDPAGYRMPAPCNRGLMIDYGLGGNGRFDPTARLRDPIVAVNPGSVELLLGWSYVDLGITQLRTPSFFSLQRERPLTHRATPPGASAPRSTKDPA